MAINNDSHRLPFYICSTKMDKTFEDIFVYDGEENVVCIFSISGITGRRGKSSLLFPPIGEGPRRRRSVCGEELFHTII